MVADLDWTRFAAAYQARRTRPFIAAMTAAGDRPAPVATGARLSPADVADQVRGEVAQVLGFKTAADVPLDRGFFEMGLDSLSSVELATRLQQRFGVDCRGFVFDTPTVGLLGEKLARDVAARQADFERARLSQFFHASQCIGFLFLQIFDAGAMRFLFG